jgi:hypothetical protein
MGASGAFIAVILAPPMFATVALGWWLDRRAARKGHTT